MDLEDLTITGDKFDLIVMNRCFPCFTDRDRLIDTVPDMLTPSGQLIVTGLNVVRQLGEAEELKLAKVKFQVVPRFDV